MGLLAQPLIDNPLPNIVPTHLVRPQNQFVDQYNHLNQRALTLHRPSYRL